DFFTRSLMRDFSLNRHRHPITRVLDFYGNLAWHFRSPRAFFLRILEYSEALKSITPDEIKKTGEFLFGFAGKSDYEGGAQCHARNSSAHLADQIFDVLTRNSDVASDFVAPGDGVDEFVAPMRWVRIKQAHPEVPLDFLNFAK